MRQRNLEFLESFDPKFFEWVASVLSPQLEGDDSTRAAVALRVYYGHGLETLFALIGALIQAPDCLWGWIDRYKIADLTSLVTKLSHEEAVPTRLRIAPLNLHSLAQAVHVGLALEDDNLADQYCERFGVLWKRFANDFVNQTLQQEYNCLKHGLRVNPGGFSFSLGLEKTPGQRCPPEDMTNFGGSKFGSSFFVLSRFPEHKYNFTSRRHMRNWAPANFVRGLQLIAISMDNVVSWAKFINGVPPEQLRVRYPTSLDEFEGPWQEWPGATDSNMDYHIPIDDIDPLSSDDIRDVYKPNDETQGDPDA